MIIKIFLFIFSFLFYVKSVYAFSYGDILINEIISDPDDSQFESIELFNKTNEDITLNGFSLEDATAKPFYLNDFVLKANGFIFFEKGEDFSFSLNNSSEIIKLKYNDLLIDIVEYGTTNITFPKKGESLCRDGEIFFVTEENTLGFENSISQSEDEISLYVSDDSEEENDLKNLIKGNIIISEYLPFSSENNEFIEIFNKSNNYIDLSGFCIKNSLSSYYFKDIILNPNDYSVFYRDDFLFPLLNNKDFLKIYTKNGDLIFNLDYKDPLKNFSYIFNENSKKYIPTKISTPGLENIIEKQEEPPIIICNFPEKFQKGLAFNFNCSDSYSLNNNNLNIEISWENKKSLLFDNYIMFLEDGIKEINVNLKDSSGLISFKNFFVEIYNISNILNDNDQKNIGVEGNSIILSSEEFPNNIEDENNLVDFIEINDISEFNNLQKNDYIKYCGIVTTLPSDLSDDYFYIEGSQIYNDNSNFISLELGDYICVHGNFYTYYSENRIKILNISDISFLNKRNINILKIDDLENLDENIGKLVEVSGKIIDKKSYKIILESDSGNQYNIQLLSSFISSSNFIKNEKYKIIGILSIRNSDYRIIPRYLEDITVLNEEENKILEETLDNNIENLENTELKIIENNNSKEEKVFIENESEKTLINYDNKQKIFIYILVFLFLGILILIIFKIKNSIKN
ncbi:lamin tail domain-containing protein [bacterium]|nr:lamin tail domain-containing protein [bacterium]